MRSENLIGEEYRAGTAGGSKDEPALLAPRRFCPKMSPNIYYSIMQIQSNSYENQCKACYDNSQKYAITIYNKTNRNFRSSFNEEALESEHSRSAHHKKLFYSRVRYCHSIVHARKPQQKGMN